MERYCVNPQLPNKRDFKRSKGISLSSKVQVLRFYQTDHIRHAGTIFQVVEWCSLNQFLHAKRRELTALASTIGSQTPEKFLSIKH